MQSTALIGFAEALSAPEVVWSLVDAGVQVKAFARRGTRSALRHSRHVTVTEITPPEENEATATAEIESLMRSLAIGPRNIVLFPLDDSAVWLCSHVSLSYASEGKPETPESAPGTPNGFCLAGPAGKFVELSLNKAVQIEAAGLAGFNVFPTTIARTADEVLHTAQRFPLILKPAEAIVSRDGRLRKVRNWICGNRHELETAVRNWAESAPLLVQPYVVGTGGGIFGFATANGVEALSGHRRLRMMNPHGSGSSACVSETVPPDDRHAAERFIRQTGWRGLFMIETLRDAGGTTWFMELNGRPWGSLALARRQGLEYPLWNAKLAQNPNWKYDGNPQVRPGIVCRNIGREMLYPLFVLRGPKSTALAHWPRFWPALAEVARVSRRDMFYNWRKDDPWVFFTDCFYTLRGNLLKRRR